MALCTAALTGATVATLVTSAGAGTIVVTAELVGLTENRWVVSYGDPFECAISDPIITAVFVLPEEGAEPIEVAPLSQSVIDAGSVEVVLPLDAPAGLAVFEIECEDAPGTAREAQQAYASLAVEKVPTGPVPETATFLVSAACTADLDPGPPVPVESGGWGDVGTAQSPEPFTAELPYGAGGGVGYIFTDVARECEITEPENGGAAQTTIEDPEFVFEEPTNYSTTVINLFVPVLEPTFTG